MSFEGPTNPVTAVVNEFEFEHPVMFYTGEKRWSKKLSTIPIVQTLKQMYASVELVELACDVVQATLGGSVKSTLHLGGVVFVGLIPSGKDTEVDSGTNTATVMGVPRKHPIQISTTEQTVKSFVLDLKGYEVDLAQDPRRQQGPVFWIGNTGVGTFAGAEPLPIINVIWKGKFRASGASSLW